METQKNHSPVVHPLLDPCLDPWCRPVTLEGSRLRLEPLAFHHLDDLEAQLIWPDDWPVVHWGYKTRQDIAAAVQKSQDLRNKGQLNAFVMVLKLTGQAVGISNLMELKYHHRSLEIGGTWVGHNFQKSFVNSEAKLLMLSHVFETLQCQRAEFRVDSLNFNSQRAVLRLGAKFEGELRQCRTLPDGRQRDYRVYSVVASEWPNLKCHLLWKLNSYVSS